MNRERVMTRLTNLRAAPGVAQRRARGVPANAPPFEIEKGAACTGVGVRGRRRAAITATTRTGHLPPRLSRSGNG
jgi:hypothetical protein